MLALHVLDEVQRLLAEGRLSQRAISRQLGVCRTTVHEIAIGRLPKRMRFAPREDDPLEPTGPVARCPGCGGKVYLPCRLCYVRAWKRDQAKKRTCRRVPRPVRPRAPAPCCTAEPPSRCAGGAPPHAANKFAG